MQQKRRYERRRESLQMAIKPESGETKIFTARDVSNGGVFLFAMANEQLPIGTELIITPLQRTAGIASAATKGRVVRVSPQGMGIEFLK